MKTKTIILMAAMAILASSCIKEQRNPVKEALKSTIIQATGADEDKIYISSLSLVDSVTFGRELEYRIALFEYKKLYDKSKWAYYSEQGNARYANHYSRKMRKDERILYSLDTLKSGLGSKLGQIAYYEMEYCAKATTPGTIYDIKNWHFIITPRYRILAMKPSYVGLRSGMGKIIPGYMTILGKEEITEEEMEKYVKK